MKTALEQLEFWIEQYYRINGTPTLDDIKGQISLLKDYEQQSANAKAKAVLEEAAEQNLERYRYLEDKAENSESERHYWKQKYRGIGHKYAAKIIQSLIPKEQCRHNNETVPDKEGFEVCPDCGTYGEDC